MNKILLLILLFSLNSHAYINNGGGVSAALTSLNSQTGASQSFSNDANVTITSSNNTHAVGWSGTLAVSRGGTGNSSFSTKLIPYSDGSILTSDSVLTWDGTNHRLGINQATPLARIHANSSTTSGTVGAGAIILGAINTTANIGANAVIEGGSGGVNSAAGTNAHATGQGTTASGSNSFTMGANGTASGIGAFTFGNQNTAAGAYSVAGGQTSEAGTGGNGGAIAFAYGDGNTANGISSVAFGSTTQSTGDQSMSVGQGTISQGFNSFVGGRFNVAQGTSTSVVSGDSSFIIGNGTSGSGRHNAFAVLNTGEARIYGSTSNYVGLISPASPTAHTMILPTNAGATGGLIYYSGADTLANLAAGTSGQILTSGGASAPTWSSTSGFATTALDNLSSTAVNANINMNTHSITNVVDPTSAQDAATKTYVDNLVNGLTWKNAVRLATTAALPANTYNNGTSGVGATLTEVGVGALTVDGTSAVVGNRILVKNEVTGANNGIYTVTAAGSGIAAYVLTRATDFDQSADIGEGDTTFVEEGTALTTTSWSLTTSGTITVGSTSLSFTQVAGPGFLVAGTGISISGTNISLVTPVSISNGGTGYALTAAAGDIVYSDASKLALLPAGTSAQVLQSNGAGAPSWVSRATTTLNNLGSTSLNADIIPANDAAINLGSASKNFLDVNTLEVINNSGGLSLAASGAINLSSTSIVLNSNQSITGSVDGSPSLGSASFKFNTLHSNGVNLYGSGSGNVLLKAADVTTNYTLKLPSVTGAGGDVLYYSASGILANLAAGTSGQILTSGGASTPSWSAASSLAITSLNSQTSGTQVFSNDTNITITSSNNTHALGFSGTLSLARGGSGANLTAAAGDVLYTDASKMTLLAAGTSGQYLISNGAAAPSWGAGYLKTRTCTIIVGADNGTALVDADLGPQGEQCFVPLASTVTEISIRADGGTPNILLQKRTEPTTVADLLSAVLVTGASGAFACAKSGTSQTCINGTTSSGTVTISNTSLAAGDWIELKSGTAGGTAKKVSVVVVYTVN